MERTIIEQLLNKVLINPTKTNTMTCTNCNKNLVAGTYPKWLCLQAECSEYLVLKTIREVGHAKRIVYNFVLMNFTLCYC